MRRLLIFLIAASGTTWASCQWILPEDTLNKWWATKETITDQRDRNGMFRGKCEADLRDARKVITSQDSTIYDLRTVASNDSSLVENGRRQYIELDKRTVPKSALPWYALAGFGLGLWLGLQK